MVQPGETLWSISRSQLGSPARWRELREDNAVRTPAKLRPGEVLQLRVALSVVELSGAVWLKRDDNSQVPLARGTTVRPGDIVTTDRGAFVCLALADGSRIVLPSGSAVRILAAEGKLSRFELLNGRLESHVEKQNDRRFEIRTRTLGLGVRGTHFRARDEDGMVVAEVLEGEVALSGNGGAGRAVSLRGGRGALLLNGAPPLPQPLLPAPQRIETSAGSAISVAPIEGARSYRVQLARDERFLQLVHEHRSKDSNLSVPETLDTGFYFMRLTAFDDQQIEGMPGDSVVYLSGRPPPRARIEPQVPAEMRVL